MSIRLAWGQTSGLTPVGAQRKAGELDRAGLVGKIRGRIRLV